MKTGDVTPQGFRSCFGTLLPRLNVHGTVTVLALEVGA